MMDMFDPDLEGEDFSKEFSLDRRPPPWEISPWVAMAALQKAVRRNHQEIALRAASTLLSSDPWRLWRRLLGICFEDVGFGAYDRVRSVVETLSSKSAPSPDQEWRTAAQLVIALCSATKDRSADDLLIAASHHPKLINARQEIANLSVAEKLMRLEEPGALLSKAMIVVALAPSRWKDPYTSSASPDSIWSAISIAGYAPRYVETCMAGYRKTRELLPMMLTLLSSSARPDHVKSSCENGNFTILANGLPGYALDMFSREGKSALSKFLGSKTETSRWLVDQVSPSRRAAILGGLLFRVEGAVVNERSRSNVADALRNLADDGFHGDPKLRIEEAFDRLRADLPILDTIRGQMARR